MDYIDLKYSRLVSSYLTGWKDVGNGTVRFRCPFCGDSRKSDSKMRGYFYVNKDKCYYKCHNCGASFTLYSFLTEVAPALAKEYVFERFSGKRDVVEKPDESAFATNTEKVFGSRTLLDRFCTQVSTLDVDHKARAYLEGRKLPSEVLGDFYYTENVLDIMEEIEQYREAAQKLPPRDAIVIPFFDENKNLMCLQFRFFGNKVDLRYLTLKLYPDAMKIWGLNRVDWSKRVYVVEGALDAVFVDNCIAVAGASLMSMIKYIEAKTNNFALIFDKDYKTNFEVYSQFVKAVNAGYNVVMFDQTFEAKDINAQIQDFDWTIPQMKTYIEKRTFSGLMAKLELSKLRPPKKRKYGQEVNPKQQFTAF